MSNWIKSNLFKKIDIIELVENIDVLISLTNWLRKKTKKKKKKIK